MKKKKIAPHQLSDFLTEELKGTIINHTFYEIGKEETPDVNLNVVVRKVTFQRGKLCFEVSTPESKTQYVWFSEVQFKALVEKKFMLKVSNGTKIGTYKITGKEELPVETTESEQLKAE